MKHYKLNVHKLLFFILNVICALFLLYVIVSYIDVLMHQDNGGTSNSWNLFIHMKNLSEVYSK